MNLKKNNSANLEKRKAIHFIVGILVTLSLVLISFEWQTQAVKIQDLDRISDIDFDTEMIQITRREEPKPQPKPELPKILETIAIVDDDIELDDVEFDIEVTDHTEYEYLHIGPHDDETLDEEEDFFYIVEDPAQFNGGIPDIEFRRYISKHLIYPEIAAENGVSGKVIVQFDIDPTGSLVNAKVLRGIDPALDKEALRVVKSSPKWTPGKQRNKPVKVRFFFPINFVLQ